MASTAERLATVEAELRSLRGAVEGMTTKLDALHAHFLQDRGAEAARREAREARVHRYTVRQVVVAVVTSIVGAIAATLGALKSFAH